MIRSENISDICFPCFCMTEKVLNCTNISLNSFPNNHPNVNIIEFSHNRVVTLHLESFKNFSKLYFLNISYNLINEVPNRIFSDLTLLQTLDLSGNAFNSIYKYSFAGLFQLRRLYLNNLIHLTTIESGAFDDLFNLKYLYIVNNKQLFSLVNSLQRLSNLDYLDLSNNSLTTLKLNSTNILNTAKLSNNKWVCDCDLKKQLSNFKIHPQNMKIQTPNSSNQLNNYSFPPYNPSLPSHRNFLCSSPSLYKYEPVLLVLQFKNCVGSRISRSSGSISNSKDSNNNTNANVSDYKLNISSMNTIHSNTNKNDSTDGGNSILSVQNDNNVSDANFNNNSNKDINDIEAQVDGNIYFEHEVKLIEYHKNYSLVISTNDSEQMCVWTMKNQNGESILIYEDITNNTQFNNTHFSYTELNWTRLNDTLEKDYFIVNGSTLVLIDTSINSLGYYFYSCYRGANVIKGRYELKHRYQLMGRLELISFLIGWATAFSFFLISLVYGSIRWGCLKCSKKEKQTNTSFREVLNTMKSAKFQTYKEAGLEKFSAFRSATYEQLSAFRLARVKKMRTYKQSTVNSILSCLDQLRETYTTKTDKITDNCQTQFDRLKVNYAGQKLKFKDSKSVQMEKIRKNYNLQADKIKEYSTQQV